AAPRETEAVLNALLPWAIAQQDAHLPLPVAVFSAGADLGRATDHRATAELGESTFSRLNFASTDDPLPVIQEWFYQCARLDLGLGSFRGGTFQRYAAPGSDPWSTYSRLRLSLGVQGGEDILVQLLELLRAPPRGFELGPVHWAETASLVAELLPREERLALLDEALRRDPESVPAALARARVLVRLERFGEAADAAGEALRLAEKHGYHELVSKSEEYDALLFLHAQSLARADRREAARAAYVRYLGSNATRQANSDSLLHDFPWLRREGD
ncbi:MAG: hypothetical protein KDD82_30135, partial [Planctomycetes bacterium]|nr:hypothetical protein [Planctomycetota bacterium]